MRSPLPGLFCLSAACLVLAACASGPGRGPGRGEGPGRPQGALLNPAGLMIAGSDRDGDYRVTAEELAAGVARGFTAADVNNDGALSLIELADWRAAAFGGAQALPGPFAFDADQDGSVSEAEFAAAIRAAAAPYAGPDGTIPFAALVRQMDDEVRLMEGQAQVFRLQRGPGELD